MIGLTSKIFFLASILIVFSFHSTSPINRFDKGSSLANNQLERVRSFIQGQAIVEIDPRLSGFEKVTSEELIDILRNNSLFNTVAEKIGLVDIEPLIDPLLLDGLKDSELMQRFFVIHYNKDVPFTFVRTLLNQFEEVQSVEAVTIHSINLIPNDELYSDQDHHRQISSPQAWDIETGDSLVIIAIVDNGFDLDHIDLKANYFINQIEATGVPGVDDDGNGLVDDISGYDFAEEDPDPGYNINKKSGYNHGTHVAGIAAAVGNNEIGISGIAWNSRILPIKVSKDLDPRIISIVHGIRGIAYAIAQGASVINLSWGRIGNANRAAQEVMNLAYQEGVIVVASAGNEHTEAFFYPASYHHVISVAWVDKNDVKASIATFGQAVDITAPGSSILATFPGNLYGRISGSSMSAPMVTGAAALLKSNQPQLFIAESERQIVFSAESIDNENPEFMDKLGSGRLNLLNVLTETQLQEPPAKIYLHSYSLSDSLFGNDNQIIEPGESFSLSPVLSNRSLGGSSNVTMNLTSGNDSVVVIENGNLQISVLPDTEIKLSESFLIHTSTNIESGVVQFFLSFSGSNVLAETELLLVQVGKAPILIVDDDDGTNNVEGFYSNALEILKAPYVLWDHNKFGEPSSELLEEFPIVIWFCEWAFPSLNPIDRSVIISYLELGGNFFLSGQDIGWDLSDPASVNATDDAREFYANFMKAQFVADDANVTQLQGEASDPIGNNLEFTIYQPGRTGGEQFPDVFKPGNSASAVWNYANNAGVGGLRFDGMYRLVYFGFGLEAINSNFNSKPGDGNEIRLEVIERVLNYLHPLKHTPLIDQPDPLESISISAEYRGPGVFPDQVNVFLKLPEDNLFQSKQLDGQDNSYSGELDLLNQEGQFEYYFELVNQNSNWFFPITGEVQPISFFVGRDTLPPVIQAEKLKNRLAKLPFYTIAAVIIDNIKLDSSSLYIYYRQNHAAPDSSLFIFDPENNNFTGYISGQFSFGDSIDYWLLAKDLANPANIAVQDTVGFVIGLDDFESGLDQWSVGSQEWGLDQSMAFSGNFALSTSPGSNYVENLNIEIQTKDYIDLSHVNKARLLFQSKYSIETGDAGFVELRIGDGEWQTILGPIAGFLARWQVFNIDLQPFLGESKCRLRFRFISDDNTSTPLPGWTIDDVRIIQDNFITGAYNNSITEFVPNVFHLWPIYPNPVRENAKILLEISQPTQISVNIYNVLGQKVREIFSGNANPGKWKWQWNGSDDTGGLLPVGLYFLEVESANFKQVQKLIVVH